MTIHCSALPYTSICLFFTVHFQFFYFPLFPVSFIGGADENDEGQEQLHPIIHCNKQWAASISSCMQQLTVKAKRHCSRDSSFTKSQKFIDIIVAVEVVSSFLQEMVWTIAELQVPQIYSGQRRPYEHLQLNFQHWAPGHSVAKMFKPTYILT